MKLKAFLQHPKTRRMEWLFLILGALSFMFLLLILGVYLIFFNPFYYNFAFTKFGGKDALNLLPAELKAVRNNIILYFALLKPTLQTSVTLNGTATSFYTLDEISHMADVRGFFNVFALIFSVSLLVFGTALSYFLINKHDERTKKRTGKALIIAVSTFFAVLIPILISIMVDFDTTFTTFHELFFPQGNWEFAPDSRMIILLPAELFLNGALFIGSLWVFFLLVLLTLGLILLLHKPKNAISSTKISE